MDRRKQELIQNYRHKAARDTNLNKAARSYKRGEAQILRTVEREQLWQQAGRMLKELERARETE